MTEALTDLMHHAAPFPKRAANANFLRKFRFTIFLRKINVETVVNIRRIFD